eukprot:TRINITY_DN3051_c0_g1_i4.p1 TRINITY_DN3051_c0_g1~~TRINITY_DN3051_c0_g1_i4.p1  ORF type:complete len:257 (-),score=32.01 TRINITY_DN3051_c0_g1_i4:260-1030(-)
MAGRHRFTHFLEEEFAEQWLSCNEATGAWSSTDSMFAAGLAGDSATGMLSSHEQSVQALAGPDVMVEQGRHRATHRGSRRGRFESIPQGSGHVFQSPPPESVPLPFFWNSSSSSASSLPGLSATELASSSTDIPISGAHPLEQPRDESSSGAWPLPDEHATVLMDSLHSAHAPVPDVHTSGQPSKGSMFHASGTCLPCRYFKHRDGCKVGAFCDYCHHPHEEWSLAKTQKFFRKHIAAYLAYHGLRGQGLDQEDGA